MRLSVQKFGGTSVGSAERIRSAASLLVAARLRGEAVVGVTSAMSGITNLLVSACDAAANGEHGVVAEHTKTLRDRHAQAGQELAIDSPHLDPVHELLDEAERLLTACASIADMSAKVRDRVLITGEKIAAHFLAASIGQTGHAATPLPADTFLGVSGGYGAAEPLSYTDCPGASAAGDLAREGTIPVVTGFCGRMPDGSTATLGRGGSDLSATLLGAALRADEVVIWTDVAGVYSADPRVVPSAARIEHLHVREASEMSYYGAKVLHPRTMIPVARLGITVWIKSSFEPDEPGTLVDTDAKPDGRAVKAVTAVRGQSIVELQGRGMAGVPGVSARLFEAIARLGVSVTMISQSSSEASICFAVPAADAGRVTETLVEVFRADIEGGLMERVASSEAVSLVAVVGLGMAHAPGIAARVFTAVAEAGVNVLAIAQGSSELNITLAVAEADTDAALRAIHEACIG